VSTSPVISACWRLMYHDVKISGARIRTHDLWIRKRLCYPVHHVFYVVTRGTHALSCRHNPGRAQHQHYINDLIWRSLYQGWHSIRQGTARVDQVRREATGWINLNPVAWRTQRHLGRHFHQHSRCIIRGNYFSPRRRCRRCLSTEQINKIC